ncbi:MobH family relaxase [Photorhabdus bodei]|uniref:TraI domain-containing protein n=1 Tax=Photorhabdus bodei TaxID=2029681 RepID=A0AAW6BLE1_9GAMM|nr:MobH family relaxase [Photorhabdus bodei]MDB6373943.1 TraI domain-containing protein [Photorhabdus bodei]
MLKFIKNLLSGNTGKHNEANMLHTDVEEIDSLLDDTMRKLVLPPDVLRYPPAEIGFPALVPGESILKRYQDDMIMAIKRELNIRDSEFNQLMMPMLINFANFVQFFPASEHHHHRAASGLLRHSLEVCFQCIRRAKNFEFDSMEVPVVKSNRILAWRLAIAAGGLLHDIGKPFTDFEVWDKTGKHHWPPGHVPIHEWAKKNKIDRFFLVWKSGRHQQHHSSTNAMLMMIMTQELHNFLLKESNDIYNELTRALAVNSVRAEGIEENAPDKKNKILRIIQEADSLSVRHDMQRYGGDAIRATQSGVPAVQRVVDAMRYLLKKGTWQPNKPGSPVWVTSHGVFIVWGTAVKDITFTVKKSGAIIPQSAGSLADLMMSYKLCIPNVNSKENTAYWRVAPHIMNDKDSRNSKEPKVVLSCLRLISLEVLFVDTMEPLPISCRIRIEGEWREFLSNKGRNVPVLKESVPYVGTNLPAENSIPPNVNLEILKENTLIPDIDELPLDKMFGPHNPVTPENAHQLLRKLNLLSEDDYQRVNARREAKMQIAITEANKKPEETSEPVIQAKEDAISKPDASKQSESNANEKKLSLTEILNSAQAEIEFDEGDQTSEVTHTGSEGSLRLKETLTHSNINDQYEEDKKHLSSTPVAPVALTKETRKTIQKGEDEVDRGDFEDNYNDITHYQGENDFRYSEYATQIAVPADDVAFHAAPSSLFRNGTNEAKKMLVEYVASNVDKLFHESGHCCIIMEKGLENNYFIPMQNSDWIWRPFMESPSDFYTHRSQMCFYLRRELNEDIAQLSNGRYRKIISPIDLSEVSVSMTDLYRAITLKGTQKQAYNGDPVIALSAVMKRRVATELNINFNQLQQIMIDQFDFSTRSGVDYILATDEHIQNFMVNKDE